MSSFYSIIEKKSVLKLLKSLVLDAGYVVVRHGSLLVLCLELEIAAGSYILCIMLVDVVVPEDARSHFT